MGRPRKHPAIPGDSASAGVVEGKGKGKLVEETPVKGRKKRVAEVQPAEGSARKRAKIDVKPGEPLKAKEVVVKVAKKSIRTKSTIVAPKWKIINNSAKEPISTPKKATSTIKTLSPRIWTGSREELLALLPDLAGSKCFNGISWYKYPTPMVVLDDTNRCFEIERQEAGPLCLDLVTTRSFVCPIPTTPALPTQDSAPAVQSPHPGASYQQPSSAKTPVIRKAPRYRIPKSLAGSSITAKVEYVPTAALSPMESSSTHTNPLVTTSAPAIAAPASILQSTSSAAPDAIIADTLPPTPPMSLPASGNDEFLRGHGPRLLTQTWHQVNKLGQVMDNLDHMMDDAKRTFSMYGPSRAVTTPSESWDGPSQYLHVVPPRLSVQSVRSMHQPPSPQVTLDDMQPPGDSIHPPYSMSLDPLSAQAHEYATSGHAPATITMQTNHAPHKSEPSTSLDPPSHQPSISTKAATVQIPLVPIMMDGTPNKVTLASEGAIPTERQQMATPQQASVPSVIDGTMKQMDLASPAVTMSGATAEHEQTCVPVMIDETATEMNLATADDMVPGTRIEPEATAKITAHDTISLDNFVPSQLPDEVAALIEAYLFGRPLSVMVSRDRLRECWGINVEQQFGYVMLGFFRILGLQESRVQAENVKVAKLANGLCAGQVQWRFHLEWAPGGEEIILPNHPKDSFDWPWWDEKATHTAPVATSETLGSSEAEILPKDGAQTDEPESHYPTTPRYRQARIANHEYQFRHCSLSDAYDSIVPEQVLAPFGRQHSDRVFPRGWLCTKCGRLNFQQALRHRKCPSAFCKDETVPVDPYYYDLYWIRDPQERLPVTYPRNLHPPGTKVSQTTWKEGTQTFAYYINENPEIFIKHIFVCNAGELQKPMSALMNKVQLTVPLLRPMIDNNPYFFYTAKGPKSNAASTKKPWSGVPACINDAKTEVVGRTSEFGEVPGKLISIKHLKIVAWITEGSKRGNEVIRAKSKCAVLLAMGCTTMLTVTPRSLEKMKAVGAGAIPDPRDDAGQAVESGWVAMDGKVNDEPSAPTEDLSSPSALDSPKKGRGAPKKKDRPSFTLSLYHGDMVVFYGDDFEYSFKRDGTSFMLFASHDEIV